MIIIVEALEVLRSVVSPIGYSNTLAIATLALVFFSIGINVIDWS